MNRLLLLLVLACVALVGCGGSDDESADATPTPSAAAAQGTDLAAIKTFLLDHTARLNTSVAQLQSDAQAYYDLAAGADFDYGKLLNEKRAEVAKAVEALQQDHIKANPDYEEMEG